MAILQKHFPALIQMHYLNRITVTACISISTISGSPGMDFKQGGGFMNINKNYKINQLHTELIMPLNIKPISKKKIILRSI